MNEWKNDWMNEWVNEWMNEWMNEWVNYKGDVMTIMTWLPITGGVFRILSDIIRWSFLILNFLYDYEYE